MSAANSDVAAISATPTIHGAAELTPEARHRLTARLTRHAWLIATLAVVLASVLFVVWSGVRPEFDTYGWLVWGREALHGTLNTNAAPSWKPLTFLFTFAYALAGDGELWLWMVTAVAAALAGGIFAGRLAYRLSGPAPGRRYARVGAAVFAGLGVLGLVGYGHLVLIAASDPMDVTLCLAAIDCHLSARPRAAWLLLVLLSLGRPEAWTVAGVYAVLAWRRTPSMRTQIALGVAVIPAMWFGIAALTSRSWLIASDIALDSTRALPGSAISRIPGNFLSLYELPMKSAVLGALVLAAARRQRTWLLLLATAVLWLATWTALALRGWNPSPRYLFEPAAVLIVLVAASLGWLLANAPRNTVWRWAAVTATIGLVVAMALPLENRARLTHSGIIYGRSWARQLGRLHAVIDREGGAKRILACGQPVSYVGFQTILAWDLHRNVSDIGWLPDVSPAQAKPIVLFEPRNDGWTVRPNHPRRAACSGLSITTTGG